MEQEKNKDMIIFAIIFLALLAGAAFFAIRNSNNSSVDQTSAAEYGISDSQKSPVDNTFGDNLEQPTNQQTQPQAEEGPYTEPPTMQLVDGKAYQAIIKTSKGNINIDLFADSTPITVNNFVFLAREKFYNGLTFHRIIKGFMIQGGDPNGDGTGGPGYRFADEEFEGEYTKGTIAMANAGQDTNGSQFFIMNADYPLPPNYVIFGRATDEESMATIDKISDTPVVSNGIDPQPSKPTEDVFIESVEIIEI